LRKILILKIFTSLTDMMIYNQNTIFQIKMQQPIDQALGFKKSNKEIYKTHFKNSVTTVYMKNRDCGNLEIPEVHAAVSFKGGQKNSKCIKLCHP